jgi:hypothetical protein
VSEVIALRRSKVVDPNGPPHAHRPPRATPSSTPATGQRARANWADARRCVPRVRAVER